MEKALYKFIRAVDHVSRAVSLVSAWGLFALMIIGIAAIVMRVAGFGLQGAINLSVYILVAIVYLTIAYCESQKQHIAVDFVVSRLKGLPRKIVIIAVVVLSFAAASLLLWASWGMGWEAVSVREKMDGYPYFPIYPAKIALVIGVILLWLQLIAEFFRAVLSDSTAA